MNACEIGLKSLMQILILIETRIILDKCDSTLDVKIRVSVEIKITIKFLCRVVGLKVKR